MKMEQSEDMDAVCGNVAACDNSGQTKTRKPRKRLKSLYSKIKDQMEFYFSDANLHMSKYMKETIAEATDGYVDLNLFLTFNKIKSLTQELSVLAGAMDGKSQLLELNAAKTHVRRKTPFTDPVDIDDRTVYVECLPHHVDHDWIKKLFASCGRVLYVSLPKYATTGDAKGFGFVTFETVEQAQMACKELHNPPADASSPIGMFPKSSHQLEAIKKKLPEEQIRATEEKAKELVQSGVVEESDLETEGKLDTNTDTNTVTETAEDDSEQKSPTKSSRLKRSHVVSEGNIDGVSDQASTPTKRKRSEAPNDCSDGVKNVKGEKLTPQGKKKSRKRKSQSKSTDTSGVDGEMKNTDTELNKSAETIPSKVRKVEETDTENMIVTESGKSVKSDENVRDGSNKKKRHRRKKTKREKELPELKVIPKTEWLTLKHEYLKLQKTSMALMKKTLGEIKNQENTTKVTEVKNKKKELEFIADVIVKVSAQDPMTRKHLKECLGEKHKIAYIDVKDEHIDGYIRCEDAESARNISSVTIPGYSFSLLTGEEEQGYWTKAISDRKTKLEATSKTRPKKRGQQKWMEKAQKASIENTNKKHIIFEED